MGTLVEKISFQGWSNCYRIGDSAVEAIVVADIGPRIIYCGFCGGSNLFAEFPETQGLTGGNQWQIYGGHRLWHSPESKKRTYQPDNSPVEVELFTDGLLLRQAVEAVTGISKEILITLDSEKHRFKVEHRMTNQGVWPITLAVWALSVMAPGGIGIVPQTRIPDAEGLLPNRVLSLWPYTDMSDPRFLWGANHVFLAQDPQKKNPLKFGLSVPQGWAAYFNSANLFLKQFSFHPEANYPDGGVNVELYTNNLFLELETLGPLETLHPGKTVSHTETWTLVHTKCQFDSEADFEKLILPEILKLL